MLLPRETRGTLPFVGHQCPFLLSQPSILRWRVIAHSNDGFSPAPHSSPSHATAKGQSVLTKDLQLAGPAGHSSVFLWLHLRWPVTLTTPSCSKLVSSCLLPPSGHFFLLGLLPFAQQAHCRTSTTCKKIVLGVGVQGQTQQPPLWRQLLSNVNLLRRDWLLAHVLVGHS